MKFYLMMTLSFVAVLAPAAQITSSVPAPTEKPFVYTPWFTGPLLSPTPINMKPGHPSIEPSLTVLNTYGKYNSNWKLTKQTNMWAINPLIDFQFGITNNLGAELLLPFISNFRNGKRSNHFQDITVLFGYQVSNNIKDSWVPDFRVILQGTFPTGKYQKFSPDQKEIDSTGAGSFQTGPVLVVQKLFSLFRHFLSLKWSIGYLFPSKVHVKGFNAYGGGFGTNGTVHPGQTLSAFFSGEYSFNQRWAFAFDTEFLYQRKSRFSGKKGTTALGGIPNVNLPTSVQLNFAPEIEYNLTANSGLLGGLWFTISGKNSNAFASAFMAYLYTF